MPSISEFTAIKTICDAYGCGNVMEWASAIWRYSLANIDLPTDGANICVTPAVCDNPNDSGIRIGEETREMYDKMVKCFMEAQE